MNLTVAKILAMELMAKHGLIQNGWKFSYDNAKSRFGSCRHRKKMITLSQHLVCLNDVDRVKNTILHEIAHALTPGHRHDSVWVAKAIEIGCDGQRCYSLDETVTPQGRYIAICKGCKGEFHKHRKPRKMSSCGKCSGGRFNMEYKLEYIQQP